MNLVIFDTDSVTDVETLISALTPNTEYLKLRYHEYNYESLKAKLSGKTYHNIAIAQRNEERPDYGFVESIIMPRVKDVQTIDPELNTWSEHIDFFAWLRDNCGTQTIDLLACNLWASDDWKYIINTMKSRLNISIRASLDITGAGGNWILESDNVETIGLYFTEDVKQYRYHLYQTEFYYFDQNNVLLLDGSGGTLFKTKYAGHINRAYNDTMLVSGTTNGYITLPSDISNVIQVIASQRTGTDWIYNAHAVLRSDGTVVTWGERYTFMFDRSSAFDISVNNVKRLYTSWSCVLALRNDNSVVAWGNGSYNIGIAHSIYTESTYIKAMPASVTNVKELHVSAQSYCALKFDGTVETWGARFGGGDCSSCQSLLTGVKKIAISTGWGDYFIALRNDGNVVAWRGDVNAGWPSGFSTTIGGTWSGKVLDIVGGSAGFYGILNDGTIRWAGVSFFPDARGYNMFFATLPYYTLPAGVTVRYAEFSSPMIKFYLSNGNLISNVGSQQIIQNSDQVIANKIFTDGWKFPYYILNRNGSVSVGSNEAWRGGVFDDATWGLPAGTDVSSNVVEIYTSEAGVAARKADGTFVTWAGGAGGRPLRFDSSANGIRDVVSVTEVRFGYKILRSNNRLYTITNPTNTVNGQDFRTTAFSDLSNILIPTNKNVWIFDNLTYEGSKELAAVELDPFESITPASFMRLQNTTIVYKSNNCFRVAKRGMKYGLYSGTTLLSTFNPLHTTMTYTFENAKVPQLGAVTLSIGLLSVNFQNTLFTFQVNTIENPFLSPPDAPAINSITVSLANSNGSVNFSLPTWDGGAPITSLKYSLDGGLSFTTSSSIVSPLSLTGLTQGAYDFVLVATNMIGDSYGTTSSIVMCNPPDAPVITSISGGNRTLTVGFTPPDGSTGTSSNLDVVGMNSNIYTVSGNANSLLNGQYTASSSGSYNGNYPAYALFDGCNNTQWYSSQSYSNPSGIGSYHFYVGSVSTAVETIGTVSGEWMQIRYPNPILVTGYTFSSSVSNYYPNTFWLVGSNNGTTWYPLNYQSGQWGGATNSNTYTINEFDSAGAYRFFRVIFTAVNGGPYVRIRNFTIIGYPIASNSIVGYKYSLNGGAYTSKGTRVSPLTISLLNNSTTYNVRMRAINAAGDSVDSNVSSNVTLGAFVPVAPTLVSAIPGQGSITIHFVPGYNGGSAITAIQYAFNVNGGSFGSFTSITPMTSPFTITGLTNGSSHYVALRAINAIGTSAGSNQIGNLVPKSVPVKPWVAGITPSNGKLLVYWNNHELYNFAQYYGGSPVTGIKYSVNDGPYSFAPNWSSLGHVSLTGLENGTEYAIRFIAVNAIGESLPSDPGFGIPCDVPSAPTITNIVALDGTANLSFTLGSNGGRAITEYQYMLNNPFKYEIRGSSFNGSHWITVPQHADFDLGTDDFTIEWYQYIPWVQSYHSRVFSFGSESNGISFCFKWFNDANTSHSTFKLQLCINNVWYDFGYVNPYPWQHIALSRVNGELRVFRNGEQLGATLDCSMNIVHSKRLVIGNDDSLSGGPQFFGTITAFTYITGWGKYTETFTPPTYPVLSVPQGNLVLFVMGARNDALGTRGSTAVSLVQTGGLPTGYYNPAYITIPNDVTSPISFGGLTNGTEYSVDIRAKNQAGYSEPSNKFWFTPLSLPDAPVFNSITYGNLSATMDFSANVLSGNSPIIGYKLSTNLGPFVSVGLINSPYTVSGLTNGLTYSFRLKAVSALGDSSSSLFSPEVIPRRVPDAPIISVVENILQATVSFTAGASNGGSQILSYIYSHNDGEEVTLLSPEAQTYTLVLGQTQTFSVRVTNDVGSSTSTSISLIGKTIPDAPVIDSIEAGNKLARVYFTAGSSNYSDITGYKYKLNDGAYQNATVSADSSILITGLSENITYSIKLVAINAIGTSDESNSMSVTPYTVPVAPVLDSVVADNASVTFSFTPGSSNSSDITAFKYSLNNAAYIALSDLTTEDIVLSDLSNGVLYNLKLKATNAAGDSLASNSLNFMPFSIPTAPAITSVTAGNESAEVYFTPGFFNGSNITQYKYALNGGAYDGTQFVAAAGLSSPIYIEGLSNGTVYSVSILAVNAAGESNASNSSTSFAPFITQSSPNPPIVQNIDVSDKTATITYVDDFNPGSAIIGYRYSLNGGSYLWFTQTSSPLIITGLNNGETYSMIIKAVNNSGASAPSEQYSFTPCDIPAAPLILNTIAGNQTATLYLGEPDSRGSEITGYYCSLNGENYYAVEMSGNQIVLDSLTNGIEYTVHLKCENSLGMSDESNESEMFITNGLPLPPVITDLIVGDETVSVAFSPADGNGKSVVKYSYCLVVDGVDGEYLSTSDIVSPIVINGLTNGVSYSIKMKTITANGESDAGLESESFIPCGIPIAPVITHVSYANDELTIHYIEENTNGKPATDHLYSIDDGMYFTTSQLSSPLIIPNLTSGGNSTVHIKTVTDAGTSAASNQSNSFIPYSMPAEPTITSVVSQDKALSVHFVDGSFNGTTLIGYKYKLNNDESFYWCNTTVSPIAITGLTNGTPYTVSLKTVTNFGESEVATFGSAVIPANLQLPPNIVNIDSSNSSVIVTYTNPQLNGATITGYKYSLNGGDFITLASGVDASNSKLTISGLTNGTSYTIRIKSISSNGDSESSNTSKTVSPFAPPSPPSISRVVTGSQIAQVYFTDGALNGSPAILGYKYSLDGTNYTWSSVTSSPIPLTGLTNNLAYTVRLIAVTSVNQSAPSSASALFVPFTLPEPPTITSVSVSNGTATISYTNGATNGRPFTGFRYSLNGGAPVTIGLENPFTITGLTNGLTYLATMNSINAAGTSVASAPSPAFVPYTVPGAPVISSIVPSDSALTMNISNPNLNGIIENGIPIIGYSYSFNNSTFTFVPTANNATSFTVTGLVNGTTYQVYVRSVTNLGLSTVSSPVSAAPRTTPSPVTITSVTAGNKSVTVAFVSGSSNGASITGYKYSLDNVNYVTATQTSSPITIFNLINGINYNVYLKASNAVGDSSASLVSSSFMPVTTLTAPLIKSIESKSGGATINVNNSYFGTVDGSGVSIIGYQYSFNDLSYNLVETNNATSFDISGLDNGSSYQIYVKTVTNIGVSPRSLQSGVFFARSVPDAPTITNVEASDSRVFLHFVDGSNNGSAITGYKYSLDDITYYTALQNTSPLTLYSLDNATSYQIRLKAVNVMGDSEASTMSDAVIPFGVPFAPAITEIVPGNGCAYVYFNEVDNNGSEILKFKYSLGSVLIDVSGLTSPLTIPNLVNKTVYNVVIIANNFAGDSYPSNSMRVVAGAPTDPVITEVVAGPKNIKVFFTVPLENGSPITQYNVTFDGVKYTKAPGLVSPITLGGLTNGLPYNITFQAVNKNGVSKNSNTIPGVIPYDIPAKITITSVLPRYSNALVTFAPPANNGSAITKYAYAMGADTTYTDISGLVPPLTIPGMPNNTSYTLKLVAYNAAGMSPVSAPSKAAMYVYTPPAQIKLGSIVAAKDSLIVSFLPPAANGAVITGYKYALNADTVYTPIGTTVPFTITGLANNVNYNIRLIATNEAGDSVPSAPAPKPVMFVYLPPAAPVVTTIIGGNQSGLINFTAPKTNGAPITGYKYSVDGGATKTDLTGLISPLMVSGLTNDTLYNVLLYADSEAGLSLPSAVKSFKPVYSAPEKPVIGIIINLNGGASISFAPGLENGSPITEYLYSLDGGATKISTGSLSLTFSVSGLTNDLAYNVLMYAVNAVGTSLASAPKAFMPVYKVPIAPTIGTITTTATSASVAFTPGLANGAPITSYKYSIDAGASWVDVSSLAGPIVISGLTTKVAYSVLLRAVNEVGESLSSLPKSFTTK